MTKITVIIPTFNTGDFLKESVGSLISQSIGFENIEVLLVDDKSSDRHTLDLINEYCSKYENVKAIFLDENSGFPGFPRNIGIAEASNDYVMVMDHDDSYEKDALETLYNTIKKENADIVICNYTKVYNKKVEKIPQIFKENTVKINNIRENLKFFEIGPSIWTKLFKKEFLEKNNIKFIEGMLAEDLQFNTNTLLNAEKIVYLNNYYGYQYKIRDTDEDKSTIHIRNKKYLEAMIKGYYKTWELVKNNENEKYYPYIFQKHIIYWLTSFIESNINDNERKKLIKQILPILQEYLKYRKNFNEKIYEVLLKPTKEENIDNFLKTVKKIKKSRKRKNKIKNILKTMKVNIK